MACLQNMRHLMYDDVFQTLRRLGQERQIDVDVMRLHVAGTPSRLHLPDRDSGDLQRGSAAD